uniref:Uncharacterized protein n=1 Tax=Avena sativa TaxID=4498 RepID=A0ACD5V8W5_AVESA
MEETTSRRNNLSLFFLHLVVAPTGDVGGQVARSYRRSLDPVRFVSGGRRSSLSRVTVVSATVVVFDVLQLCAWMTAGDNVSLLRLRQMKTTMSGSGDHGEDPQPTCHKVSGSSLATTRFIGSKSILVCDGALPDLRMEVVRLFFRRYHGGGGGRWTMVRRGTSFSKGGIIILLAEFFVQSCLISMFVLGVDHICNLWIV